MIIDSHTHIFPDQLAEKTIKKLGDMGNIKAYTNGTKSGLLNSMKEAGVNCSIILPVVTRPEQFKTVNEFAVKINEKYQDSEYRLLSFGGIHPDSSGYKGQLKEIVNMGLLGIKLHPDYQDMYFDDIRYMRLIDYASELGLIISVHAGLDVGYPEDIHCPPKAARKVIDEVAPEKLILAHLGGYQQWDEVEDLLVGQKVYLDTAYIQNTMEQSQFLRILKNHGSDKILFATDSPWSGQKESVEWMKQLSIPENELNQIFYGNIAGLLNF